MSYESVFSEEVTKGVYEGKTVDVVYMVFSKAFKVPHYRYRRG